MKVHCTGNYKPPTILGTECNKIQPVEVCYNMQQVSIEAFFFLFPFKLMLELLTVFLCAFVIALPGVSLAILHIPQRVRLQFRMITKRGALEKIRISFIKYLV